MRVLTTPLSISLRSSLSLVCHFPLLTNFSDIPKAHLSGRMHDQMLSVMLMRMWRLVPRETSGSVTLPRPFVLLVQKLSQRAPEVFLDHCSQAAHALNFDVGFTLNMSRWDYS